MNNFLLIMIYLVTLLLFIILTLRIYRLFLLPNTIFTILWCFCGIFSIYNRLGLVKPEKTIHFYILISIFTFNIAYFVLRRKSNTKVSKNFNNEKIFEVNKGYIYSIILIAIVLITPNFIKAIKLIISNGFNLDIIRKEIYVAISNSNNFYYAFFTKNIPTAIFTVVSLISSVEFFRNNNKHLTEINIICLGVGTLTFGGRYLILNCIIFYAASYLILKKHKKIKLKKSYIAMGVIVLLIITLARGTNGMSVFDMIISYFVGSFSYLQVIINNPYSFGLNSQLMFGYLTFGFVFEPIVLILKFLFRSSLDVPSYYFNIYAQPFVNISESGYQLYNNNTTMLYTFIRDFGEYGIVVGTIIIALFVCISENKYYKEKNLRALFFLVYMYSVIINSVMMYTLTSISASLVIIFLYFSVSKKKKKL